MGDDISVFIADLLAGIECGVIMVKVSRES